MFRLYKNIRCLLIFFFAFGVFTKGVELTKELHLDIELWSKLFATKDYVSDKHLLDDLSLDLRLNFVVNGFDNLFVHLGFASLKSSQVWNQENSILYYDGFFQKVFMGYEGEGYKATAGWQDSLASENFFIKEVLKLQHVGLRSNFFLLMDRNVGALGFVNPYMSAQEFAFSYRKYLFDKSTILGAAFIPKLTETYDMYGYKESALEGAISYNNTNGVVPFAFMLSTRYYITGATNLKRMATALSARVFFRDVDLRIAYLREFYLKIGSKRYEGLMYSFMYPWKGGIASFKFFDSFIRESDALDKSFFYQAGYSYALGKYILLEAIVYASHLDYSLNANVLREQGFMFGLKYQYD